jgi:hypothetical protein
MPAMGQERRFCPMPAMSLIHPTEVGVVTRDRRSVPNKRHPPPYQPVPPKLQAP